MVQSRVLESESILNFSVRNRSLTMACPSLIAPAPQGRAPGRTRQRPAKEIEARRVRPGLCVRLEKFCGGSGRKAAIHVANRCSHQLPRIPAQRHSHDDRRYTAALRPSRPSSPGRNRGGGGLCCQTIEPDRSSPRYRYFSAGWNAKLLSCVYGPRGWALRTRALPRPPTASFGRSGYSRKSHLEFLTLKNVAPGTEPWRAMRQSEPAATKGRRRGGRAGGPSLMPSAVCRRFYRLSGSP